MTLSLCKYNEQHIVYETLLTIVTFSWLGKIIDTGHLDLAASASSFFIFFIFWGGGGEGGEDGGEASDTIKKIL